MKTKYWLCIYWWANYDYNCRSQVIRAVCMRRILIDHYNSQDQGQLTVTLHFIYFIDKLNVSTVSDSGFWNPTGTCQVSSPENERATLYFPCTSFYDMEFLKIQSAQKNITTLATLCLLRIAVRSHRWRWQHHRAYSHLPPSPSPIFLCFFSPSFSLFSITRPYRLYILYQTPLPPLVADPQRQSALFCLSASRRIPMASNSKQSISSR